MFKRQSPLKRKQNEYHDPDYPQEQTDDDDQPGCSKEFANKKRKCEDEIKTNEVAGKEVYLQKVRDIIEREFHQEIILKQQQLEEIDERLGKAQHLLDKLRYGIVAAYYKKQELPLTSADAASLKGAQTLFDREDKGPQMPLHPSLKKLIGKRPKDLSDVIRTCPKRTAAQNAVQTIRSKSQAQKREERKIKQIIREQGIVIDHSKETIQDNDANSLLNATQKNLAVASPTAFPIIKQEKVINNVPKTPSGKALNASRLNNKIKHMIVVGNTSKYIGSEQERDPKNTTQNLSHKWLVYVQAKDTKQPIDRFVKKVRFFLHHSYRPNDVVDILTPPFQVSRRGWGEFPIRVQLFFHPEYHQKPVQLVHNIILDQTMSGIQTLGAETLLEIWLRATNTMDPPITDEVKLMKKPDIPQKPKLRLMSRTENLVDDNLLDFLNKIESTPCSISADIEKIQPTVVVTELLAVKSPSPEKTKFLIPFQQKSPAKTVACPIKSPKIAEKSLNPTLATNAITNTSATSTFTPVSAVCSTTQLKQRLVTNGSLVSKPMTTFVKLPQNSTQIKIMNTSTIGNTANTIVNMPPLRPLTPSINMKPTSTTPLTPLTVSKPSLFLNKDCKILMPSASVASAVRRTILPIITNATTSSITSSTTFSTNLSNFPNTQVVTSTASSAPKQILQKKLVQLVDSTGKVKYMQMLVAASSASSNLYSFNQSSSVAPKLITMAPSLMKNNTVTNTTQITNTTTTPLLKSGQAVSLTPAITMKPNIFKIVPETMQTKPQILTFSTNTQQAITTSTITTAQQQQTSAFKAMGITTSPATLKSSNNLTVPVANKLQKPNGNNTATNTSKNVVFQKEGKLYIIDPLQMKLKQQQKKQFSLLKPQVSLLKRQQKPAQKATASASLTTIPPPPPPLAMTAGSKLNIASTSAVQLPNHNTPQLHYGLKQQRLSTINSLQLMQMKRILFEKQFLRQEFTNLQSAVEFLLRRLTLIVAKDSLQSAFPFVCHSLQEFQALTAFKQRACEWLRAKNVSRIMRNHKDLQKINQSSKETFWTTKEIAMFARQYAYTPAIKSLPRPGDQQTTENSKHFMDLVKSELKQEHVLPYDSLTDHHKVSKWVDKVWHTLEDHEHQENQHQIIDIDTIAEEQPIDKKKVNSLTLQSSATHFIPKSPSDVYLPPPIHLENQCQLVSDICKDLNFKLMPEQLQENIYHSSTQTVLAQCLHIFIEKLLRQSIAVKQQKQSTITTQDSICTILPQDLTKVLASCKDYDFLTNNNFGSSSLVECFVSAIKQEQS